MRPPRLPGYTDPTLLGFGGAGEVWRACEVRTGDLVALKRLRTGASGTGSGELDAGAAALRREAALLSAFRHPHVVRLRQLVRWEGEVVLVLDYAGGGSLARLVDVRGPLRPGEVVTVAVPIARALAEAHRRGLVHGDVTPGNVLFSGDGVPLLADLGLAALAGRGTGPGGTSGFRDPAASGRPGTACDVYGLGATALAALGVAAPGTGPWLVPADRADPALRQALLGAVDPDPRRRPDAARLARQLFEACPPEPVVLTSSDSTASLAAAMTHPGPGRPVVSQPAEPRAGERRRPARHRTAGHQRWLRRLPTAPAVARRRSGVAFVALLGVIAAVAGGMAWAWADRERGVSAASIARAAPNPRPDVDWATLLGRLDARRARAFSAPEDADLAGIDAPGSAAESRDAAALRRLRDLGARAAALKLTLLSVAPRASGGHTAVLLVRDRLAPYAVVRDDGIVLRRASGRGPRTWRVVLRRDAPTTGWRLADARPVRGP